MPTIALKVQQDGRFRGWFSLVGASFGYQTIDDSEGTAHDSGATSMRLPRFDLPGILEAGRVSFPLFLQAEGLVPISIRINLVAQKVGVISNPRLQIGFQKSGLTAFSASLFAPGASWTLAQRTFSTNPITGQPWSASDLVGLEACIQSESGIPGSNDLTLVSGSMDYYPTTNSHRSIPWAQGVV